MRFTITLMTALISIGAYADGFVCYTNENDLKISVYNHTKPELGTRNAAMMILSNPELQYGSKTIAKFTDISGDLISRQMTYTAIVNSSEVRTGELISGTKLGEISRIDLNIDFSYSPSRIMEHGDTTFALLQLTKSGGAKIERKMTCFRYLKNNP